jgi:hypothetical protein
MTEIPATPKIIGSTISANSSPIYFSHTVSPLFAAERL